MYHQVNETLTDASSHILTFKQDYGYIEKDWGHSFPEKYIWSQANHFPKKQASLMVSVLTILLLTTSFVGFKAVTVKNHNNNWQFIPHLAPDGA